MKVYTKSKTTVLTLTLVACAFSAALTAPAAAQGSEEAIQEVMVTASRIPHGEQAATGVTVLSAADLENQGFRNVYDALS